MKAKRSIRSFFVRFHNIKFLIPFLIIAVVVFVGLSIAMIEITGQNFFCGTCHEMREHYYTWKVSAHKDTKCKDCHIPSGIIPMAKTKIAALKEVYVHVTENKEFEELKKGLKKRVPDESCKKCHKETQDLIVYHSLKITHKDHWERGISCVVCHDRVVHGPRAEYKNTPSMGTCRKCHDGQAAPDECSTCHVTLGTRNVTAFDPEWVDAHKIDVKQNEDTCKRCHHQDFCNNCHTSAKPHTDDWFRIHDTEAEKDRDKCSTCHKERYCSNCHEIRREHALDWPDIHGSKAKEDQEDCDRCHKENFCSDCHTKFVKHPDDWLDTHSVKVEDDPESCETCHTMDFCITCHGD